MNLKELTIHRIRDFDIIMQSQKKSHLLAYILIRQILKLFGLKENKMTGLLRNNMIKLHNNFFLTREHTLDILFFSRYYEPETTKYIMRHSGKIFLDIGAHTGRYAILASKNFQQIYAIEPHPSNYKLLLQNIKLNSISNIVALNCALSNENRDILLSDLELNTGIVSITPKGKIKSKSYQLDYIIETSKKQLNADDVDLILIDVENHELEVLLGSKILLHKGKPIFIIESYDNTQINNIMEQYGYKNIVTLDFYNHVYMKQNKKF